MSLYVEIYKAFDDFTLDVKLEAGQEVLGILGDSGCGKTMTLKAIAGIIEPDYGKIILNDRVLFDSEKKINLKPRERNVGLLFQNYALFDHMSVYDNIVIGMTEPKAEKEAIAMHYMKLLQIEDLGKRRPKELSGGQQQRVALARLLVKKPDILMLDEPFSALDNHLRYVIEPEFRKALEAFEQTVLYISHNRNEIYKYCDETAIMAKGKFLEKKKTEDLFNRCETFDGARLTGCRNLSPVKGFSDGKFYAKEWDLTFSIQKPYVETFEYIGIREGDIQLTPFKKDETSIPVTIGKVLRMPDKVKVQLQVNEKGKLVYTCSSREYSKIEEKIQTEPFYMTIEADKWLLLR